MFVGGGDEEGCGEPLDKLVCTVMCHDVIAGPLGEVVARGGVEYSSVGPKSLNVVSCIGFKR